MQTKVNLPITIKESHVWKSMQKFGNGFGRNVVIFCFDNISSSYTHNQKSEGINNSVGAAEKNYY